MRTTFGGREGAADSANRSSSSAPPASGAADRGLGGPESASKLSTCVTWLRRGPTEAVGEEGMATTVSLRWDAATTAVLATCSTCGDGGSAGARPGPSAHNRLPSVAVGVHPPQPPSTLPPSPSERSHGVESWYRVALWGHCFFGGGLRPPRARDARLPEGTREVFRNQRSELSDATTVP